MSKATLLYLKERPVNSKAQGSQSNPRCHDSAGAVVKEQKCPGTIARHQSKSDMPMPLSRKSAKQNVDSSNRGQASNGSAEAPAPDIHTPFHSPAPEHTVHDEGGTAVASSSKEHIAATTGNEVMTPHYFLIQRGLTTRSNRRMMMGIFGAIFAHIYCTTRISPPRLRSSTDALQEVGLFCLCRHAKSS